MAPVLLLERPDVEAILRKYLWVLDVAVAAVCAVFLARATASLAESQMIGNMPPRVGGAAPFMTSAPVVTSKDTKDILARNIFCADCPPFEDAPPPSDAGNDQPSADAEPERTSMPLAVMAIMYAPPPMGITYSMAVIKDTEKQFSGAYSVGDQIRDAKIIGIDETRIHFDNRGRREYLDLLATEGPAPVATAVTAAPAAASSPADELSKELAQGLKKTGENTYELQRSTLDSVLGNMSLLSRSARIVPEVRDGKSAGFRLYAVRPEGPFALIGMQNGDVLYGINGLEMSSPEKALEVYSKLKSARHLSVSLERNGQKLTKEYTIR